SGSGGISHTGFAGSGSTSVLALTGANTYTGPTTINAGIVVAAATNALPATTAVNLASGPTAAQLWLHADQSVNGVTAGNYNQSIGSLAGVAGSAVELGTATLTIGNDNTSPTFAGNFRGSGSLVKVGTGFQTLTGSSNGVIGPTVNAGQILLGGSNWGSTTINGSVSGVQTLASNVFSPLARVTVNGTASGGFVGLNGFDQSIGSLAGT